MMRLNTTQQQNIYVYADTGERLAVTDTTKHGREINNNTESRLTLPSISNTSTPIKLQPLTTDTNAIMMNAVTMSLGQALSNMAAGGFGVGTGSPQDMIQFGLGVGMALMQSGAFKGFEPLTNKGFENVTDKGLEPLTYQPSLTGEVENSGSIVVYGDDSNDEYGSTIFPILSEHEYHSVVANKKEIEVRRPNCTSTTLQLKYVEPINHATATMSSHSVLNALDHREELSQIERTKALIQRRLTGLEVAGAQTIQYLRHDDVLDFPKPAKRVYNGMNFFHE